MKKCKFYSDEIGRCLFDGPPDDCPFEDKEEKCACFKPKMIESGSAVKAARQKSLIKLELIQYPYPKSGPTVYLDDYQIAGPRAYGVGPTVASYELKRENLEDIQRIVTRELNRLNGIK